MVKKVNTVVMDSELKVDGDKHLSVYRYDSISHFKWNVRKNRLYFSKVVNWDDQLEQLFVNRGGWTSDDVACLCMTSNAAENSAAAWKMHKKDDTTLVQIEFDIHKIEYIMNQWLKKHESYSVYIKKVKYLCDDEIKKMKKEHWEEKEFSLDLLVDLLSVKRKDFMFEGEIRIFIVKKKMTFDKIFPNLFEVKFDDSLLFNSIEKISLEPFPAEFVKKGPVPKREDDEELQDMLDFAKAHSSRDRKWSRFVQRKRLYEKDDV